MLSGDVANVFERKVWRVQEAHLHNTVRALSSPCRCFHLSTNLDKDFCRYLWYCGKKNKKTDRLLFSMALLKFHWFGINWHVFMQKLYIIIQKIAPQAKSGKYFQIWFPPRFFGGGGSGGVLSMRMQILDSLFARPGSAPIRDGRKRSSGTGLKPSQLGWPGSYEEALSTVWQITRCQTLRNDMQLTSETMQTYGFSKYAIAQSNDSILLKISIFSPLRQCDIITQK